MKPFLLPEVLSQKFKSIGWINRVDLPKLAFDYQTRLDLFSSEIWDIAKRIMRATRAPCGKKAIPICHVTLANGSEQDLYVHLVQQDDRIVFLEVSHSYLDHHFLPFQLWATDKNQARNYPIDELFQHEVIDERMADETKPAELLVKPVKLTVHTPRYQPPH